MKNKKSHSLQDALVNALDNFVADSLMAGMAPPGEHVGFGQHGGRKTVVGLVLGCGPDRDGIAQRLAESSGDYGMDAVGVDLLYGGIFPFMDEFVPDCDAQGVR
jgi:hypothetical protein